MKFLIYFFDCGTFEHVAECYSLALQPAKCPWQVLGRHTCMNSLILSGPPLICKEKQIVDRPVNCFTMRGDKR